MRKNVSIVGVGPRRTGVSKAGNPYDIISLSVSFTAENYDGARVAELTASMDELNECCPGGVFPGDMLTVFMHEDFRRGGWVLDGIM